MAEEETAEAIKIFFARAGKMFIFPKNFWENFLFGARRIELRLTSDAALKFFASGDLLELGEQADAIRRKKFGNFYLERGE